MYVMHRGVEGHTAGWKHFYIRLLLDIIFIASYAAKTACGRSADVWLFDEPMSLV
jgi:hypothetical protein